MRRIHGYATRAEAQSLSDHLEVQGIENCVREADDGHAVWVIDDEQLEAARAQLEGFKPGDTSDKREAQRIRAQRERDARPIYGLLGTRRGTGQVPLSIGVVALVIICGLVALLPALQPSPLVWLGFVPLDPVTWQPRPFVWSEPWRLITPIFIHFGLVHILFNMLWLHRLGGQIETFHGIHWFAALVAVSAVAGNGAQYAMTGPYFGGMSGVNYALFGFVWMQSRYAPRGPYHLDSATIWMLMVWLIVCGMGVVGPIANAAHAVGLMVGVLAGVPAFVRFRATFVEKTAFAEGSWEDLNIRGWRRFERLVIRPYLPLWFLGVAVLVLIAG